MRRIVIVAGVLACLGLSACEQSKSQATEAAPAPEVKKSLSRPAQLYFGQEQILQVDTASVEKGKVAGALSLKVTGQTPSAGYYQFSFVPRINAARPADGIYDVDVVGYKPQSPAAQAVTPMEVKAEWGNAPVANLKGVRFIGKNNSVVAMLPAG